MVLHGKAPFGHSHCPFGSQAKSFFGHRLRNLWSHAKSILVTGHTNMILLREECDCLSLIRRENCKKYPLALWGLSPPPNLVFFGRVQCRRKTQQRHWRFFYNGCLHLFTSVIFEITTILNHIVGFVQGKKTHVGPCFISMATYVSFFLE